MHSLHYYSKRIVSIFITATALLSCKTSKEASNHAVQPVSTMEEGTDYSLTVQSTKADSSTIHFTFQIEDSTGTVYSISKNDNVIKSIEVLKNDTWIEFNNPEEYTLSNSSINNCKPTDYCVILDLSGSMASNKTQLFREADQLIDYKNNNDNIAFIKYTSTALVACTFLNRNDDLTRELFDPSDSFESHSTNTDVAYQAFTDSLKDNRLNEDLTVILFSDYSGLHNDSLYPKMQLALNEGIQTHRIVYTKGIFARLFYEGKRNKERRERILDTHYGMVYKTKDFGDIGDFLKQIVDNKCMTSSITLPLFEDSIINYRITTEIAGVTKAFEWSYEIPNSRNETIADDSLGAIYNSDTTILLNIHFNTGSDFLLPESYSEIDKVVELMNTYPKVEIEIQGHTDNQGSESYNYQLSNDRAHSVCRAIINKGIAAERIAAIGYGYSKPIATNNTPEGRALNRRTEFKITKR